MLIQTYILEHLLVLESIYPEIGDNFKIMVNNLIILKWIEKTELNSLHLL